MTQTRPSGFSRRLLASASAFALLTTLFTGSASADEPILDEELDPARNKPLPCEVLGPGPSPSRSENNLIHLANRCGIVGTDVEFQSRKDANGNVHDYAFVGTMGFGFRIFDITDPFAPAPVGGYVDTGWQNDIQVRGNVAVSTFDGVSGEDSTASTCLKTETQPPYPTSSGQGVDIFRLNFNATAAVTKLPTTFNVSNIGCVPNPPGGAHNSTLHPSGKWLAISNSSSDWAVDVVDLRNLTPTITDGDRLTYRLIDASRGPGGNFPNSTTPPGPRCPDNGTFTCIVMKRPAAPALGSSKTDVPDALPPDPNCPNANDRTACGLWRPHDVHFSRDGNTMYVAALNSTFIVNVRPINQFFSGGAAVTNVPTISIIPNIVCPEPPNTERGCGDEDATGLANPHNLQLSHQADVNATGKILVIGDERGGGLQETSCNTQEDEAGVIGGLHFWALAPISDAPWTSNASPSRPVRMGAYFNPNPSLGPEPLQSALDELAQVLPGGRLERACTTHVFRLGENGTASPGPVAPGFDGVSRHNDRVMSVGWYGAGVWRLNFWGPTKPGIPGTDIEEESRSTWGNTMGWNVQPGSEAWSGKEYKGFIYAGDMLRGFDVYACAVPGAGGVDQPVACPEDPVVTLTKTGPVTTTAGSDVTYTIKYTNAGPAASWNAKITDVLPSQVRFVSATNGGSFNSSTRTVTWNLGKVLAGASGTVTLTVRVPAGTPTGTTIVNEANFSGYLTVSPPTAKATTIVQ